MTAPATTGVSERARRAEAQPGRWWARPARLVGAVVVTLLVVLLLALLRPADDEGVPTDPTNPRPSGSKALVEVLRQRGGIQVDVARTPDDLRAADVDANTTVVVTQTGALGSGFELTDVGSQLGRLVLVEPDNDLLDTLEVAAERVGGTPLLAASRCTDPDMAPGWRVTGGAMLYRPTPATPSRPPAPVTCLQPLSIVPGAAETEQPADDEPGQLVPGPDSITTRGAYLRLPQTGGRPETVLLGTDVVLLNRSVTDADHAALALRLLGRHPRLVWYLPTPSWDTSTDDAVVPPWFGPGVLALAGVVVGLMLWRGRRLGRLTVEPLPAVVPATEITQARGRLYQRAREPGRALELLRSATAHRLRLALGLPDSPGPSEPDQPDRRGGADLSDAVAQATGRSRAEVAAVLDPAHPTAVDETMLVRQAQLLEQLEREVRGR